MEILAAISYYLFPLIYQIEPYPAWEGGGG